MAPLSKFKEDLSVAVPPSATDPPLEHSRFSPDSPTERRFSLGGFVFPHRSSLRSRPLDLEKNSAAGYPSSSAQQSAQPSIRDRLARPFVDFRVGQRRNDDDTSAQPVEPSSNVIMPVWRSLDIRKPVCNNCHVLPPTQKWYNRAIIYALVIFLLYLFINVIVLNVRLFSLPRMMRQLSATAATPPESAPTTTVMLSGDTQQCITQYTLNAPGDPTGYPCSTCAPLLAAIPSNATAVHPVARDAEQFCGLRSIWEDAGQQGQAGLEAGGWVKDIKFCTWNGVRCDGAGRVSSLQLTFPAIPASLPEQITNLTALESLEIVGNDNSPAGSFPTTFGALTKLTSLHLENTALGPLPDTLQTLTSLTLVHNAKIGSSLPPSIGGSALRSLIVTNEQLKLSAAQSAALCGGQLQNCDLRGSGIHACGACLVG